MQMIRAIIRTDREDSVLQGLESGGFVCYTRWEVIGRGKQKGIKKGDFHYLELYKTCLMLVVEDDEVDMVKSIIQRHARTGKVGDGKVFVTPVESALTIRTGRAEL